MAKPKKKPLYHLAINELWTNGIEPRLKKIERALAKVSTDQKRQRTECIGFKYDE